MTVHPLAPAPHAVLPTDLEAALRAVFGERLHLSEAMRLQHGRNESHHAAPLPSAVVFAHSTEEVVQAVRLCAAHSHPIIPYGAGTSLEGHFAAVTGGLTINLGEMNQILRVSPDDLDCTVQAGVRRHQLNEHLRDMGLFFPIDPGADATIGGMASTRASGTNAVRYGTMREAILSLRVVTPQGEDIVTRRRVKKTAAGYDITSLYIGAEGTLGIITEVTLRLHGIPEAISAAVCSFETLQGAVDTVVQTIQLGVPVARVELLDDVQMASLNRYADLGYPEKTTLFFEFHGSETGVAEQAETVQAIAADNGGEGFQWATKAEDRNKLWKARHNALYANLALKPGCVGWTTDVCVPIGALAQCITETKRDLETASLPAPIVGHVGDGNFHTVLLVDPSKPEEIAEAERLNARLVRRALDLGGTCTGEHGIGIGKMEWLEEELGEAVNVMRRVKAALDPQGIMNPAKIFR